MLAFWPALLLTVIEYPLLRKTPNNFTAKTIGAHLMVTIIPLIFYSYTAFSGKPFSQ
jgi:hypothetical protein